MRFAFPVLLILCACTQFPQLDSTISPDQANAPYPQITPLGPIFAQRDGTSDRAEGVEDALGSRLANLRARADGLRGPVIEDAPRARMERGVRL